jgi:hypothetical protein
LVARGDYDRPRTVNAHLLVLKRFLDFLSKEGVVSPSLPAAVEYVKAPETHPDRPGSARSSTSRRPTENTIRGSKLIVPRNLIRLDLL